MGCALSDEDQNGADGDVVEQKEKKKGGTLNVILTAFEEDGAEVVMNQLIEGRKAKGCEATKGQPNKFHGDHTVTIDVLKPEKKDEATVRSLTVSLDTMRDVPACQNLVVKASSQVNGILVVVNAARLVKPADDPDKQEGDDDEEDHHRLTKKDEEAFLEALETLAKLTDTQAAALQILVINAGCLKGDMEEAAWKEYCHNVEFAVQLNFAHVEHMVMEENCTVCFDDTMSGIQPGMEWLVYKMNKPNRCHS